MNAKKKKRSRCELCGEQWWHIGPMLIILHMGFDPQREVQKKYGKCAKINDPANSVWRQKCAVYHANAMRKKDAKKATKVQGKSRSSRLRTRHSDREAWTWSLLIR